MRKIKIQTNNLKNFKKYGNIIFGKNYYFKKEVNLQMKEGIHPTYNQTTITCACGNVLEVG